MAKPKVPDTKPFKCPLVAKITPLGCLLNKLKHGTCKECPGVDGFADHVKEVQEKLVAMAVSSIGPMPKSVMSLPGVFIPMEKERIKALEIRGVGPEQAGELLEMFLAGEVFTRKPVIDPIAKSRIRPEG